MPEYLWNDEKNEWLRRNRGLTFDDVVYHITCKGMLDESEATMGNDEHKKHPPSDAPLTDAEFDAWWPFSDADLDEYEREIEEAIRDYEWVPPPQLGEEQRRARMRVRRELAAKYPDGIPGGKTADAELPG